MDTLTLEQSKEIWSGEGYTRINNYFCKNNTYSLGNNIRGIKNKIEYKNIQFDVSYVITVLKEGMKKTNENETYYRGDNEKSKQSFKKEGFISVSQNVNEAITFMDNGCCLFEVTVDNDVLRLNTGVEKEILIEDGCYWEYTGISKKKKFDDEVFEVFIVKIHSPKNVKYIKYPIFGECLVPKKMEKTEKIIYEDEEDDEEMKEMMKDYKGGKKKRKTKNKRKIKKKRKTIKNPKKYV
jgi:hypothetical protein